LDQYEIKTTNRANVLAYIEGIDPVMKQDVVILSAHYDHLKEEDIYLGRMTMFPAPVPFWKLQAAIAKAKAWVKTQCTLHLMTGEEKGCWDHILFEHPVFL
jgi:hypothetical protein